MKSLHTMLLFLFLAAAGFPAGGTAKTNPRVGVVVGEAAPELERVAQSPWCWDSGALP